MNRPPRAGKSGPNPRDIETRGYRPKADPDKPANPRPPNVGSAIKPPNTNTKK